MCFELRLLHTPAELIYNMIEEKKYENLVDIGEMLLMASQIEVKTCLNTHFWGNKLKFQFIPCRISNLWGWTGEIIEISIISLQV